ncbi:MAG: transposase [bacterium]|nr:transposase [bacterium]
MPKKKTSTASPSEPKPKESAVQLIQTVRRQTKTRYSAEDKIRIILEGLRGDHPVAELCRREGISGNGYYVWLKEFMEAGKSRLKGEALRGATKGEVALYRRQNEELRQTVADLMLEVRALKKSLF